MVFEIGEGVGRATLLEFNEFVLQERRAVRADVLAMSFNAFDEVDLAVELAGGETSKMRRLSQLSQDDNCTVFCGIKTVVEGKKSLSVAVAHKGRLYDITDRTVNLGRDDYTESNKLKIYNTIWGKIAVLIDTDAAQSFLWQKITAADFVLCFEQDETQSCEITKQAITHQTPTIIITPTSAVLVR